MTAERFPTRCYAIGCVVYVPHYTMPTVYAGPGGRTHRRVVVPVRRYDPRSGRWCTQRVAGPFDDQPTFDLS